MNLGNRQVLRLSPVVLLSDRYAALSEYIGNGAVRRVCHPSVEATSAGRTEKRTAVQQPHGQPVVGRLPLLRPQPHDAILQTADGEDIHAVFTRLPERDI